MKASADTAAWADAGAGRPAHAGCGHGRVRPLRRGGGAGGEARAAADQETETETDAPSPAFRISRWSRCDPLGFACRERLGFRRSQQRRELAQLLGVGGAVPLDRCAQRLLVGVDELLLVAGLDGEVDPGQVGGLSAVGIGDGRRDLRLVLRGSLLGPAPGSGPAAERRR